MATKQVEYVDSKGRAYLVEVPEKALPSHYSRGVRLGPPDLKGLVVEGLMSTEDMLAFRKKLVAARLVSFQTLKGSRALLRDLLRDYVKRGKLKDAERWTISIYTYAAFG